MIRGIITDLDGVMLDSMHIWNDLGRRYLAARGIPADENTGRTLYDMNMSESSEYLSRCYMPGVAPDEIRKGLENMLQTFYAEEVMPKPGAAELLEFFTGSGLKVTAATTCPGSHAAAALKRTGIGQYISRIFTSEETCSDKNDPGIYDAASGFMGTVPGETLVLEDAVYALRTAKKAGYITAGIYDPSASAFTEEIQDLSDIYTEDLLQIKEKWPQIRSGNIK